MSNFLSAVEVGGQLRVVDSFNCPHCPDHCEPFSDLRALNNHIKWDHELKHLLDEEKEEMTLQMKGVAANSSADGGRRVPHSKVAKDSTGSSSCGSSNSGTYFTATEGEKSNIDV